MSDKPMDEKTLTALQGSIKKWESIVAGTLQDKGYVNCPLCQLFIEAHDTEDDAGCVGCPVSEKTGLSGCSNTPYDAWDNYCSWGSVTDDTSRELAQAELDFLRSLLPKEPA